MEKLSAKMAKKGTGRIHIKDLRYKPKSLSTRKEVPIKKKKRSKKKKNALKYGKLYEFPTFQHDKQTTVHLGIIFTIRTCIVTIQD
jgi:hypothetical protein